MGTPVAGANPLADPAGSLSLRGSQSMLLQPLGATAIAISDAVRLAASLG
jgi:hypothetical protein